MQHRGIGRAALLVALALFAGACGGGGGVGKDLKVDKNGQSGEGALGRATTTLPAVVQTTAAPTATTAKPTPTTVATPVATFTIQSDSKGQYIEPLNHAVRQGQLVRFINQDTITHVIDGKIGNTVVMGPSPSIAPNGGIWDVRPTVKGTYDIVDEQRPYAAGVQLTVN